MVAQPISDVAAAHGLTLVGLPRAAAKTDKRLGLFQETLQAELGARGGAPEQMDVVLFGSFARAELTGESDCDYLVLLDGTPNHSDIKRVMAAVEETRSLLDMKGPGVTGTFGDFATATELFTRIGLESDSNANTTRRLLLLSESVSVVQPDVTEKIKKSIIARYLGDYASDVERNRPVRVPHFLLNDVVRYWRTIAVDFGAKQWRSFAAEWHLRHAKLLTTRKVLFAGTLAVLLDSGNAAQGLPTATADDRQVVFDHLTSHLLDGLAQTPLARLMSLHSRLEPAGQSALASLLSAYDEFVDQLDDHVFRNALSKGSPATADAVQTVDRVAKQIHEALLVIFFDDPLLRDATREFGVF